MATEKQSEASEATRPTVAKEFVFDDDDHYYVDLSKVPMRSMIKEDELEGDSSSDQLSNSTTGDSSSDSDDDHQATDQSLGSVTVALMATETKSDASEATRPTVAKEFVFIDDGHHEVGMIEDDDQFVVLMQSMIEEDEPEGSSSSDQPSGSTEYKASPYNVEWPMERNGAATTRQLPGCRFNFVRRPPLNMLGDDGNRYSKTLTPRHHPFLLPSPHPLQGPQGSAALYLRSSYGRCGSCDLAMTDYAEPTQTFGAVPIGIECSDELQLPPVPAPAGLCADVAGAATEHLAGVEIFKQKDYVYRLTTMKRFHDETLISILQKMRKSGGSTLTREEKKALRDTDVSKKTAEEQRRRLANTELWYQAAPTWATVAMAQVSRSRLSAVKAAATLYVTANNTGRLPSVALLHIGMIVRLTKTIEAPEAVTDSTGEIVGIDVAHDEPRAAASGNPAIRILEKMPVVTVKLHEVDTEYLPPLPCEVHAATGAMRECPQCDFRAGCIAVEAQQARRSFPVEVQDPSTEATYTIQVQRVQLPMTIKTASTIHTLQGTTAEPGIIFHWKFPRFFSAELRWLATYVALSRPPSLKQLISVDLPDDIEALIQGGPPEGILSKFDDMFKEKELGTHEKALELMRQLGWNIEA